MSECFGCYLHALRPDTFTCPSPLDVRDASNANENLPNDGGMDIEFQYDPVQVSPNIDIPIADNFSGSAQGLAGKVGKFLCQSKGHSPVTLYSPR